MIDTGEWEHIYIDQRPALVAYATMFLGSGPAAEDVVQECITHLLASDHLAVEDPKAYLWRSVTNRCRREYRRAQRRGRFDPEALEPWLDRPSIDLLAVIGKLTSRRRTAVLLRYYVDLPVTEIAEWMECAPSTVSSLLNRAYRDLEKHLS